jgi:hypothetical protein
MRAVTDRNQALIEFLGQLRPRNIWRRHILYNRLGMTLLNAVNRLRWLNVDIPVILWPPAREHFDAIERDIRDCHQVLDTADYLIDAARFDEFVRKVYAIDSASPGKIDIKLGNLVRTPLIVRVLTVRFRRPRMEAHDILNRVRCKDAHRLKERIRADYHERVPEYIFDVIVHSTETAVQGEDLRRLLPLYVKPLSDG